MKVTIKNVSNNEAIKRNSSIELLKIFAMVLIAISHSVPFTNTPEFNINLASTNINIFILVIFKNLGHIGNLIFIISSAYFLTDSKKTKKEKVINLIIDTFTISMFFLILVKSLGFHIQKEDMFKQFFSIIYMNNWFVSCYLIIYIIHPLLNIIIKHLNKKQFFRVNIIFLIYLIIQIFFAGEFYYNDLIGFIIIYFFVAYMKLYMKEFQNNIKLNYIILFFSTILYIILLAFTNILGLKYNFFSRKMLYWNRFDNLLFVASTISLFNIFKKKEFKNRNINYISSLSLYFYLIHENMIVRIYLRPILYYMVFSHDNIIPWILLESIILFAFGIILAYVYNETISKATKKLSGKLCEIIKNKYLLNIEERLI